MKTKVLILKNKDTIKDIKNKYIFNIGNKNATIDCNIKEMWSLHGIKEIHSLYEDLFIVSLAIFAADKKIARKESFDAWTRNIEIEIPVLNLIKWNAVKDDINKMLSFLTGDIWYVKFYETKEKYFLRKNKRIKNTFDTDYDVVNLFSGGLDSFCGAIYNYQKNIKTCFVGNREYTQLKSIQDNIYDNIAKEYPLIKSQLNTFTVQIHDPLYNNEVVAVNENTTRSRSLMFIAAGLTFANISKKENIPLLVPENAFIGLNLPMTNSRLGSCSTRTTHPYYLNYLNDILENLGIKNKVSNPFKFLTKTEVVRLVENTEAFKNNFNQTISCSHPGTNRWIKGSDAKADNCGVCYPCLIRQSCLFHLKNKVDLSKESDINIVFDKHNTVAKNDNLYALLNAINIYINSSKEDIYYRIRATGYLSNEDAKEFTDVYIKTMNDLISMISNKDIKMIAGLK